LRQTIAYCLDDVALIVEEIEPDRQRHFLDKLLDRGNRAPSDQLLVELLANVDTVRLSGWP
jgi:hypothetical protein